MSSDLDGQTSRSAAALFTLVERALTVAPTAMALIRQAPGLRALAAGALAALGALFVASPASVARHAHLQLAYEGPELASTEQALFHIGISLCILSLSAALYPWLARHGTRALSAVGIAAYLPLTLLFADWHVDDAAITYAYAENLVLGHGLVLHPSHAPEEGYSNSLWLLLLAVARLFGLEVALAAKLLGTATGALALAICLRCVAESTRKTPSGPALAVVLATLLSSPFVIWTVSGLEHGLQAVLLLGLAWSAGRLQTRRLVGALCASALVLVRPEAPLLIAALAAMLLLDARREGLDVRSSLARVAPIALAAGATLAVLLVFRWVYFGDLLPNPYYAKAQSATVRRLLNPLGGGWMYVFGWLKQGAGYLVVAPLCALSLRASPPSVRAAVALLLAQVGFVIYAEGDWMAQWRFLTAPIALLAFLAGHAIERECERPERAPRTARLAALASFALLASTTPLLAAFRAHPTTPYATVAEIGAQFVQLAERLSIARPLLAHHDAGGTSYRARIELLDLGGLGDRTIAKNSASPAFLRRYILAERKPDFVFGTTTMFAARKSGFHETEQFKRDYVRIEVDHPLLAEADLCHVRRDRVREAPGIEVLREAGVPVRVVVTTTRDALLPPGTRASR